MAIINKIRMGRMCLSDWYCYNKGVTRGRPRRRLMNSVKDALEELGLE